MTSWLKKYGRFSYLGLGLYWLALFAGTHIPRAGFRGPHNFDKVLHFSAYLVLAMLSGMCLAWRRPPTPRTYLGVFAVLAAYGAVDELLQIPIPTRVGDPWDWVADAAGAIVGLLLFAGFYSLLTARRRASLQNG